MGRRLFTTIVVALVLVGLTVVSVPAVLGYVTTGETSSHAITECTTIEQPGAYVLTSDVEMDGEQPCIEIAANDVSFDGHGYSIIESNVHDDSVAIGTTDAGLRNVTVTNVTTNGASHGIELTNVTEGRITDVTATSNPEVAFVATGENITIADNTISCDGVWPFTHGIRLAGSNFTVTNNEFDEIDAAIESEEFVSNVRIVENRLGIGSVTLSDARDLYVAGNVGEGANSGFAIDHGADIRLVNNTWRDGVDLRTLQEEKSLTNITIRNSTIVEGVIVDGARNVTMTNNTLSDAFWGVYLRNAKGPYEINHNRFIGGQAGVRFNSATGHFEVTENYFATDRNGISIGGLVLINGADNDRCRLMSANATVSVRRNVFPKNLTYGVYSDVDQTVSVTNNYWGAASGPSSPDDVDTPLHDPVTGTLADGNGSAVSEDLDSAGYAAVRFDPWLSTPPQDAGVVNATGN